MRQWWIIGLAAVMWCCGSTASPARADVTDTEVSNAIKKGVQFLYSQQKAWGHWDIQNGPGPNDKAGGASPEGQFGGWTALILDALLSTGEEYQSNPKLQKAMEFLTKTDPPGTYATGLRAHVWPQLPDQFLEYLQTDAYRLMQAQGDGGAFHYALKKLAPTDWDNSCTQYGILGAWECAKRGVSISRDFWAKAEKHFLDTQNADGGWGYQNSGDSTMTMTAAGLACLYITEDYLHAQEFLRPGITENHPVHKRIEMGVKWFDKNFGASNNGYAMVGVERVGIASGRKYFRGQDWYRVGAEKFVATQGNGGSMGNSHGADVNTAFALIFLSRGQVPVFINKLEIPDFPWQNRPRDIANLTAWASDEFEIHMNWQVVDLVHPVEELMDAPVLYLSGHQPLALSDEQVAKLKQYIDMGGLMVFNADASSRPFVESVQQMFEKVYPYKFKPLPPDDTLMDLVYPIKGAEAMVLDNGLRHLAIILTRDPASNWQVGSQRDIASWHLMGNIFEYAIEKTQPRNRLEIHTETKKNSSTNTVYVGRAKYDGNWNPEPMAWRMQGIFDNNQRKADPKTLTVDLKDIGDADVSLVHVVGTDAVQFTDEQIAAVQKFVNAGGVILFETAGGQPAFTDSVRTMLAKAFPDKPLRRLSPLSALVSGSGIDNAYNNARVDYRVFYKQRLGVSTQPSLQAVSFDDQPRVIVSAEDMSNAMLGQPVWGIFGYDTQSARQLMTNILLYAKKTHPAAGKVPEQAAAPAAKDAPKGK